MFSLYLLAGLAAATGAQAAADTKPVPKKAPSYVAFEWSDKQLHMEEAAELNRQNSICRKKRKNEDYIACFTEYVRQQQALGLYSGIKLLFLS